MKRTRIILVSVTVLFASSRAVLGQERTLARKDLPPAVERTVVAESRGATIKGFASEVEDGRTLYEVEMTLHGHSRDVSIDSTGTVVEVEEEVAFAKLTSAVRAGLSARAAGGKITRVESITRHGTLVAYEAQVSAPNGKKSEIEVGPDGKPLTHPE